MRGQVAPLAGAWIETTPRRRVVVNMCVAPLAGAWIETASDGTGGQVQGMSLPSRERGLKLLKIRADSERHKVAPLAGAWIETEFW